MPPDTFAEAKQKAVFLLKAIGCDSRIPNPTVHSRLASAIFPRNLLQNRFILKFFRSFLCRKASLDTIFITANIAAEL